MNYRFPSVAGALLALVLFISVAGPAQALSIEPQGIDKLIGWSEYILVGEVTAVSDGFDGNVPYTEVVVAVDEAIRGDQLHEFTFRQFGLLEPREMPNGLINGLVTPQGWPTWQAGESVILFLYQPASLTGLRTTVGLQQGKFVVRNGVAMNAFENRGLFRDVPIRRDQLTVAEQVTVDVNRGPLDAEAFLSFIRKAVANGWFEAPK